MAKQVLMGAHQLMLPDWQRRHTEWDISGESHDCEEIRAARWWGYTVAKEELWQDGIRPDVFLSDDGAVATLPLLAEVKVSHAVEEQKARLVAERGWAMLEIDLSKAQEDDTAAGRFEEFVLAMAPRKWIHAPKAERRFAEKCAALREFVAGVNDDLRRQGVEEVDEFGQTKRDRARQRRIDGYRMEGRKPYLADIKALERKTQPAVLRQLEEDRREKDAEAMRALLVRHGGHLPFFATVAHKDSWVVNTSTARWHMAVAERFVYQAEEGARVSTAAATRWVADTYGIDEEAGRLIEAQRKDRERRRLRGDSGFDLIRHAWFFSADENRLIPNLFHAVDALMSRLVAAKLLLAGERWTYEVDGRRGKEKRRLAEERRSAAAAEERRKEALAEEERQRLALLSRQDAWEQRQRRIEGLTRVYQALLNHEEQCLDCQACRWPRAPDVADCTNCGSGEAILVRLDAQRLREVPHRLRSDPCIMTCQKYLFE